MRDGTLSDLLRECVRDSELEPSDELPLGELSPDDDSLDIYPSEKHTKSRAKAKIVKKRKEHNNKTVNINEMEYESKTSNLEQKQTYEEERRRLESRREQATS